VSARVRNGAENSVNLLRWGADITAGHCTIEQWDYAAHSQRFERTRETQIQPSRKPE